MALEAGEEDAHGEGLNTGWMADVRALSGSRVASATQVRCLRAKEMGLLAIRV